MKKVTLDRLNQLPQTSGVYFVCNGDQVLYVGQAKNLKSRWKNHHRFDEILDNYPSAEIGWFEADPNVLDQHEKAAIETFKPLLNNTLTRRGYDDLRNTPEKMNFQNCTFDDFARYARDRFPWFDSLPETKVIDGLTKDKMQAWELGWECSGSSRDGFWSQIEGMDYVYRHRCDEV